MLRRSVLVDIREGVELANPDGLHYMHSGVIDLDDFAAGDGMTGRCRCGTWAYIPALITTRLFGHDKRGRPYTLGNYVASADSETSRAEREAEGT